MNKDNLIYWAGMSMIWGLVLGFVLTLLTGQLLFLGFLILIPIGFSVMIYQIKD